MFDAHCHIDLFDNPHEVAYKAEKADIKTIAVTNLPSHFEVGYPHIKNYKRIRLALGLHPLMASSHKKELAKFKRLLDTTSYIGEIGLDFSRRNINTKQIQIDSFEFILNAIKERPRFITIHSRKAEKTVLELLNKHQTCPVVFHWYNGPLSLIDDIVKAGHYFSINPAMTLSKSGQKVINKIAKDRILTETDGPFVQVAGKPAEPFDVSNVLKNLAECWNTSVNDVEKQVEANFKKLLLPLKRNSL